MDDGYMVGPREVIFEVLVEFTKGLKVVTRFEPVARKCKMFNLDT